MGCPGSISRVGAACRVLLIAPAALLAACWEDVPDDSCTAGESRCSGEQYQICSVLGVWESRSGAGQCGGLCTPGSAQCQGTQYQVCSAQGMWESLFVIGRCGAACTTGASRCSGIEYQTCTAQGTWEGRIVAGQCGAS